MNLRQIWTEIFKKPAGRLILFIVLGGILLAFVMLRMPTQPKIDNHNIESAPATQATGYSYQQDIPISPRAKSYPLPEPTPFVVQREKPYQKAPPPIPQTIFATKEPPRSENYLPFGRLLRCELVNTVDSTNIATPIIGLVIEDLWRDGRLIIPAGTEVHGIAQKAATRERIGSERQWIVVFQDGRELPLVATVLDYAPDPDKPNLWSESDGSAGLKGFLVKSDQFAEAKAVLAAIISAGAGAFPATTNLISPLTGSSTQLSSGGFTDAFSAGISAGADLYSQRLLEKLEKDPFYVRVPGGTLFYLYVAQTVDLDQATAGLSAAKTNPSNP